MKFIPSEALSYPVEVEALFTLVRATGGIGMNAVKDHWKIGIALECGYLREKVQFAAGDCCHAFSTVSVIS